MTARRGEMPLSIIRARVEAAYQAEQKRCADWVKGRLSVLPFHWAALVGREHARRGGADSPDANRWLMSAVEPAEGRRVPLSAGESDLRASSVVAVSQAKGLALVLGVPDAGEVWAVLADLCGRWGAAPPKPKEAGEYWPAVRRMLCRRWWLRALRRVVAHDCEAAAVRAGLVRRGLWCYCSQDQLQRRRQQRARQQAAIDAALLTDTDTGEQCDLSAVVEGSVANPAIKRGELMVRIKGADEYARAQGWACEFWTVTCPSRYHAQVTHGATSEPNPRYCGATPREAQAHLREVWARARASWDRRGLQVAGLRTAEPHHDGCPHWHLIVYGPEDDLAAARDILRDYALRDAPDEAGAQMRRFVHLASDGNGASYAAKYISKNIDGANLGADRDTETGRKLSKMAERVTSWAAAWRIRQFQFFGMPGVTAWRALRRVSEVAKSAALEAARSAADVGDWCGYWSAVGSDGLAIIKDDGRLTEYGDKGAGRVVGVSDGLADAMLAVRAWVISWGAKIRTMADGDRARGRGSLVPCL